MPDVFAAGGKSSLDNVLYKNEVTILGIGNGSLRDVVFMGLHVCQMMGYEEIMNSYRFITTNAARTLHLGERYGIAAGRPANFIVLDAQNYYDALNRNAVVLRSVRGGKTISRMTPAQGGVLF